VSRADELGLVGHDLANGRLTTGYAEACTIIRELEAQIEDLNKATDRIAALEAEIALMRPVVDAAVAWRLATLAECIHAAKKGGQGG